MFKGRFALVTGGVTGLGQEYVKQLLQNGIEGITIIDVNHNLGNEIEEKLMNEYGSDRVFFIYADVSKTDQLKDAFDTSFKHWNGLDIVINNAGMINEQDWNKTISLNCGGTVHGTYLGFEYMSKLRGGRGGVVVNISSIAGAENVFLIPTYSASKSFVLTFSRGLGNKYYYEMHDVKVLVVCPGLTITPMASQIATSTYCTLSPGLDKTTEQFLTKVSVQPASHVAKHVIELIDVAQSGSAWIIEREEPPYQIYEQKKLVLRKKHC
ncbi:hypothetical protein FQR65_LT02173 [Abscondita terminalis]|nr:hypothetical protein FQR65_LT02173 [Abscondita terminalis]